MSRDAAVTSTEHHLRPGEYLVSRTDLQGKISYVNLAFVWTSGFSESELLGMPHSIIRHPDMPGEAFKDLWRRLRRGHAWTGLVKNRRKNGDFYWVRAHVTPLQDNGLTTGYLAVSTRPTREEARDAEAIYATMRTERSDPTVDLAQGTLSERAVQIVEHVEALTTTMEEVSSDATEIGEIAATVNAIAFQTNIALLNATVRAARNGEEGRAFAVVAGEVRELAQRSAVAAREVRALVGSAPAQSDCADVRYDESGARATKIIKATRRVAASIQSQSRHLVEAISLCRHATA